MKFVWIIDERIWGKVLEYSTHFCLIEYTKNNVVYEEYFELDELIDAKELGIDYETEEGTEF